MITRAELCEIGYIAKPHGVAGEMNIIIPADVELEELSCIVLDMDGIFVPFFSSSIRRRGSDGYLVTIDGINSETEAAELTGKTVYALERDLPEDDDNDGDGFYAEDLIGYHVSTDDNTLTGEIVDIDDSTENILFVIKTDDGRQYLIPVADEFIDHLDPDKQQIRLSLPEGLLEI